MKKYLLLAFLPFLFGFTGPGPRDDGYIYVTDYGAKSAPVGGFDSSAAINQAEADARLIATTVRWPSGFYNACLTVPPDVINEGVGRSFNFNTGTYVRCPDSSKAAMELVPRPGATADGPYTFRNMVVNGLGSAFHANASVNDLVLDNITMKGTNCMDLAGHLNYPVKIERFVCTCVQNGLLFEHHLGNAHFAYGKFGSPNGQCVPITINGSAATAQEIVIDTMDFSLIDGPDVSFAGNVSQVDIERVETERYVQNPTGDIVFGVGNYGHIRIAQSTLGVNADRAIINMPGYSVLESDDFGAPVQVRYPQTIEAGATNSGPTPLLVFP